MSKKTITDLYKLNIIKQLQESVSEQSNSSYYFFLGVHAPRDIPEIPDITNDLKSLQFDPYREMVMGKRITPNDLAVVVRNIPYVSNTVYAMYDDTDSDLFTKDFYVVVNNGGGSYYHVFKCLDNNGGEASTVEPDFAHIVGSNTTLYQTSDGYRWKYMFSTDTAQYKKFASTQFINIYANTDVQEQAVPGAIDIIKVENTGRGYDNYYSGTFASADLKVNANPQLYRLGATSSLEDDFYVGCLLYISNGDGSGNYRRITEYNGTLQLATLESPFPSTELPTEGSQYQVYPEVAIIGNGINLTNAIARAIIDPNSGNSVLRVEMLERGQNYDVATASVVANSVVLVGREASLRPIQSPTRGHGFDPENELGAVHFCIGVTFSGTESNTLLLDNEYQQYGVIKDPLFSNVRIQTANLIGVFKTGELTYKIDPIRINKNVAVVEASDIITCEDADYENQVVSGDLIYIISEDGLSAQISEVESITNSSSLVISDIGLFTDNAAIMYLAGISSNAYVANVEGNVIYFSNVIGILESGDTLVGRETGAVLEIDTIKRSDDIKGFDTFIQLYRYTVTVTSGTFEENEILYTGANSSSQNANSLIHSTLNIGGSDFYVYVSNQLGIFASGDTVRGLESAAVGTITAIQSPEIKFGSGDILYLENIDPISRQNSQSESFKIYLEF